GRFHRGPQANPTCRIAETQPRTSDARPYIRFVTRSAWVRFGGRATTHRNCQLSIINDQNVRYSPMGSAELLLFCFLFFEKLPKNYCIPIEKVL
ncbi:MAG: hypothetical protein IKS21_01025, partial [Oscillospiraceae bacterium]|nr:hypothetical protein [Oscillospiraceae bacterium]